MHRLLTIQLFLAQPATLIGILQFCIYFVDQYTSDVPN